MLASYFLNVPIDLQTILVAMSVVMNTVLGILIFVRRRSERVNQIYIFNIVCIVLWAIMIIGYRLTVAHMLGWTIALYVVPTFIASSFLYFSFLFPEEHPRIPLRQYYAWIIVALNIAIVAITLVPGLIIQSVEYVPNDEKIIHFGSLYIYYATYISGFFGLGLFILARKLTLFEDVLKKCQLKFLLWGYLIASTFAMLTNLVFPYLGYFKLNWLGQALTVFMVLPVTYAIFKHRLFDVKVIATELITAALWVFLLTRLLLDTAPRDRIIDGGLLFVLLIVGVLLIRSVDKEVEQREKLQKLTEELQQTNERQETLIHFIGHEVKGFLTKAEGALAELVDGDFGALPEAAKPFTEQALAETRQGVDSVATILKASNLKKGTVTYTKAPFDLKVLVAEVVEKERQVAEKKGLTISFDTDDSSYEMTGDKEQLDEHVLRNLIDNAISYTPSGSIVVSLQKGNGTLVFSVKDSGIGICEDDKKCLFTEGGHGKDSQRINVHSTGYGLYIAKSIVEAHGGTVCAESEGTGKGSTFVVELPV